MSDEDLVIRNAAFMGKTYSDELKKAKQSESRALKQLLKLQREVEGLRTRVKKAEADAKRAKAVENSKLGRLQRKIWDLRGARKKVG